VASLLVLAALVVISVERLGWMNLPHPAGNDYQRYGGRVARVVKVVDGDTLDVDIPDGRKPSTRIRLWGVDTPEVVGSRDGEMYFGPEASAFTKEMMDGREVRLELSSLRTRDKYGRLLAYVYRTDTGEMLAVALLKSGHAYADTRFDHEYKSEFARLERQARRSKAGLWDQYPRWKRSGR
jgi:micrococcal nuclease